MLLISCGSFMLPKCLETLKKKKSLFTLPLRFVLVFLLFFGFVFHCRHVVCDTVNVIWKFQPKHDWIRCTDQCNVSVHFVWLSIEFPLGLRNEYNFLVCLCEDGILIYVKRFKFTLYIPYDHFWLNIIWRGHSFCILSFIWLLWDFGDLTLIITVTSVKCIWNQALKKGNTCDSINSLMYKIRRVTV